MSSSMPVEYVDASFSFFDGTLDESRVLPTVHELTGRRPRTFEQWALAHADEFPHRAQTHSETSTEPQELHD